MVQAMTRWRGLAGTASFLLVAGACSAGHATSPATTAAPAPTSTTTPGMTVVFGFYGTLSGASAAVGTAVADGEKLAVSQYMAGHPTVPVTVDAVDSVGAAPGADRALATAGAAVVLEAGTSAPAVEAAGIAHITVSDTAVALAGRNDSGFLRAVADDAAEGIGDANFVVGTLGAKTVAVIDDASTTGRAVADYVRDALPTLAAVDVVDVDAAPTPVSDATVAAQIAAAHPAVTFYGGGFAGLRSLQDALAATTWGGSVVAGGGAFDPAAAAAADPATDGAVISCVCDDTASDSAATTFTTAYQAAYGTLPPPFAAEAFDVTNFALAGVSAGAATSGTLAAYLRSRTYDGLTKALRFDARGEAVGAPVYLYGLKGGQLTRAGTTPGS